jgi:hypothetical protein
MAEVRFYTSNPGLEVLLGEGPVINIVELLRRLPRTGRGPGVLGLFGAVVNDLGTPNTPLLLSSVEDLADRFGGFKGWLGDGLPPAEESATAPYDDRGSISGYDGNLYGQAVGGSARTLVLTIPNLEIRDGSDVALEAIFGRTAPTETYTLPAGTRFKEAAGYTLATLEDVTWIDDDTTDQSVRCRQVSPASVAPVALNTVDTFVDSVPSDVDINTVVVTVPESVDAAEVLARYTAAFAASLVTSLGMSIAIAVTDRYDAAIADALGTHVTDARSRGFFRIGVCCPPIGTTVTQAQAIDNDGVGRPTLSALMTYAHPADRRAQAIDADNLNPEDGYLATIGAAMPWAFRIAAEPPEANPARPHKVLVDMRRVGVEPLAVAPVPKEHWTTGIVEPTFDLDIDTGGLEATYFSGILKDAFEIADRRMLDFIYNQSIRRLVSYHKGPARPTDEEKAVEGIVAFLDDLIDDERLRDYAIASLYDGDNQHLKITLGLQLLGNFNVITLEASGGTSPLPDSND